MSCNAVLVVKGASLVHGSADAKTFPLININSLQGVYFSFFCMWLPPCSLRAPSTAGAILLLKLHATLHVQKHARGRVVLKQMTVLS